ncbi:hypothetical protein B0T25DRAFT_547109 [Lasiosphaeria hispida]|uniref:HNH nuclease domain-containing protein n=1 Tax=Lasiosphaeria hispida TaxID=260671 RepID=A0AAJ0MCC9_9PEZI|nr:hypothetical protein B0T25DRAFT_547109 [Lasiosphaeria hispida]
MLGIEVVKKKKEELLLKCQIIIQEHDENLILPKITAKRLQDTDRRYFSTGDELWRHNAKKACLDDPGVIRFLDPISGSLSDCLLVLYKKSDGLEKTKKQPLAWHQDALAYYDSQGTKEDLIWCHVCGDWMKSLVVKAVYIMSFFLNSDEIGEILFRNQSPSFWQAGNVLLLLTQIKKWFNTYHIIIDIKCKGWEEVWVKYYQEKPFLTPGNYICQSMLIALAMHFRMVDMTVIDLWIADNGFDMLLKLTPKESAEAACWVYAVAECAMACADQKLKFDDSDEDSNEDSDGDSEKEEEEEEEGTCMEQ